MANQLSKLSEGSIFLDRYRIESTIEDCRKGAVYKATDLQRGQTVALKIISRMFMPPGKDRARFLRGLRLAQRVIHPNVCRLYEVEELPENIYVSMEFLEGTTLSEILMLDGRLRFSQALPIFKYVLAGLSEAHRAGVIHRNLKPQNIMIGTNGEVRLMDFATSISLEAQGAEQISGTGEFVGTPSYMAPEQFNALPADQRTDIYAFGVLMFHVLTGRLPFPGKSLPSLIYAHASVEPDKPSTIIPDFPVALESIILKSMAKDPNDRYQWADDVRTALRLFEESARKFRERFEQGKLFYDQCRYRESLQTFREAQALFPDDPAVRKYISILESRLDMG